MAHLSKTSQYTGNTANGNSRNHYGDVHGNVTINEAGSIPISVQVKTALFVSDPREQRESLVTVKGRRVTGTCEWILNDATYRSWADGKTPILWISGGPGKGKTMMAIFLTEHLEFVRQKNPNVIVTYCFCRHQEAQQYNRVDILRALIWHLMEQQPDLSSLVDSYFESDNRAKSSVASAETLWIMLSEMLKSDLCSQVWCILDGLDECDEDSKAFFTSKITQEASRPTFTKLHLILLSRDIPRLRRLPRTKLDPDHDEDVAKDIDIFIKSQVEELSFLDGFDEKFKVQVQTEISQKAGGTFLWVGFAMHELLQKSTCSEVISIIHSLPAGLDAIYQRMLEQIPQVRRDRVGLILRWMAFAAQPLGLGELSEILNMHHGANIEWEQRVRDEVAMCGPMLQITQSKRRTLRDVDVPGHALSIYSWDKRYDEIDVVTLVHQSANDFLRGLSHRVTDRLHAFCMVSEEVHLELTRKCVDSLENSFLTRRSYETDRERIRRQSLLDKYDVVCIPQPTLVHYALNSLLAHLKNIKSCDDELWRSFNVFLQDRSARRWWSKAIESPSSLSPLQTAAYLDIIPWVTSILHSAGTHNMTVDSVDPSDNKSNSTALYWACARDHLSVVQLLLDYGADPGRTNSEGETPLMLAVRTGNAKIVRMILNSGASSKRNISQEPTLLGIAVRFGHAEVVQLLLMHGWDSGSNTPHGHNMLRSAVRFGHAEIVRLLLRHDAGLSAYPSRKDGLLELAARLGHMEVVLILLESSAGATHLLRGGDVSVKHTLSAALLDRNVLNNVLRCAIEQQDNNIVQFLLDAGADANVPSKDGDRLLSSVAKQGTIEMVKLLLRYGAKSDGISLFWAVSRGDHDMIRLFLGDGVNINAVCKAQGAVLQSAVKEKDDVMVKLLDRSANVTAGTEYCQTPLQLALQRNDTEMIQLLLEGCSSVETVSADGDRPLHIMVRRNDMAMVHLLLSRGANINAVSKSNGTSLQLALQRGDILMVELLLDACANIEVENADGDRPLHTAVETGNTNITRLLIDRRADVNAISKRKGSPLHIAVSASSGDLHMVRLLLDCGANVNATNAHFPKPFEVAMMQLQSETPLQAAMIERQREAVRLLTEHGADLDVPSTVASIFRAVYSCDVEQARLLLASGAYEEVRESKEAFKLLSVAMYLRSTELARLFIYYNADVNVMDIYGKPLLHYAMRTLNYDFVRLLLDSGANIL